jgi:RHS repeat-associated protein
MISEVTDGVILDYVPDALGSIHSVIDQDANVVKTMRYKPYGEVLSRSGTIADRHYQWVGSYGYRATFAPSSSHYVRARHYSATAGSWTTVDPLVPRQPAFGYVGGRASRFTDSTGLKITVEPGCANGKNGLGSIPECCKNFRNSMLPGGSLPKHALPAIQKCLAEKGFGGISGVTDVQLEKLLRKFGSLCSDSSQQSIHVTCPGDKNLPPACNPCKPGVGATTIVPLPNGEGEDKHIRLPGCGWIYAKPTDPCYPIDPGQNRCTVINCGNWSPSSVCTMLFHEAIHCMGSGGPKDHDNMKIPHTDIIYAVSCCVCEFLNGKGSSACSSDCRGFTK